MSTSEDKKTSEYQANLEAMRTMVIVMCGDREYTVQRDDRLPTAMCNTEKKRITLTEKILPNGLPQWKAERLMDGVCAHEGGHVVVTAPYHEAYKRWIKTTRYPVLAKHICNVLDDLRVNFYVANRYRFDFGQRLIAFHLAVTPSMADYATKLPLNKKRLEKAIVILNLKVLGDIDLTYLLDSEAALSVREADKILKTAKFKKVTRDLVAACDAAYKMMEMLVSRPTRSKRPRQRVDMDIGDQKLSGDHSKEGEEDEEEEDDEPLGAIAEAAIKEVEAL